MTININTYLAKQYPQPPCWFLVADVYHTEFNEPVELFKTVNASVRAIASAFRIAIHKNPNGFRQVPEPVDGCIVLLGRNAAIGIHHCGVYTDGRVLHMLASGGYFEELSTIRDQYALVEFWAKAGQGA